MQEQITAQSIAAAASVAAAAVNAAVSMRTLDAPDVVRSYVYRDGSAENRTGIVDEVGLPLVYDKTLIQEYWKKQGSALTQRWSEFLRYAIPFLTKILTIVVSSGPSELQNQGGVLARDARIIMEKLGPTYIKLGQMMSVRPDVLPKEALQELQYLQDSVKAFETPIAISQIESELGGSLSTFFSEISEVPVAAASLAQVYKAKLASTGEYVAIKVQRPRVLETVSKDLYVLRRAAEVYQGLIERFAPQQRTNYVALLNEWAVGFYTELDFLNEASNQMRLKDLLAKEGVYGASTVYIFDLLQPCGNVDVILISYL
jgi:predicted unusual protein kinase regulating ubiquinone biosynthesis (AarF/ABC1/UbiB family)